MCFQKCAQCGTSMNLRDTPNHECAPPPPDPTIRAAERAALTALAKEHADRFMRGGLIGDMHLMAQRRAEAYRDTFYPDESPQ